MGELPMPAKIGADYHIPKKPDVDIVPDIVVGDKTGYAAAESLAAHATYMTSMPFHGIPKTKEEWNKLSPEEQRQLMHLYRAMGIPCRQDIKDRSIPVSRSTMDLP